ncbi:high choriolytic enzyme 1-like [Sinocyclocheilus rhinocerous]|uniref:high choriolytic enzyme 1-like n=1 Tax=Sinocyclocheilus rhinocerous TaxID=307959 RepID=UPI0007B954EC|nr:PREDICTED: high choriolytic enzyme 1-like [Sinocyclocheilus rhinocerous]
MDPRASLSILVLLVGISLANPVRKPGPPNAFLPIPGNVDITTKFLETNKGSAEHLIEGDLVFPKTKNALYCLNNNCFWKRNSSNLVEVPYIVSSEYSSTDISVIQNAMSTFHNKTCIRFVPRSNQTDYISIENKDGCYSYLGRIGGKQLVSLKRTGCVYHGIIQHELNHALGFYHEHTRSDRDQYVKINWEYIPTEKASNFQIRNTNNQNTTYDYGSIMHYGKTAFTTQAGKETITPIPDATVAIGQRQDLSKLDILRINKLYGCVV